MFEVSCLKLTEKNGGFIGGVESLTGNRGRQVKLFMVWFFYTLAGCARQVAFLQPMCGSVENQMWVCLRLNWTQL